MPQRGDLPVYLPANGALLAAGAMMAGGWDDAPKEWGEVPGFPVGWDAGGAERGGEEVAGRAGGRKLRAES